MKNDAKPSSVPKTNNCLPHGRDATNSIRLDTVHNTRSPDHSRFSNSECKNTGVEGCSPPNSSRLCIRKSVHGPSKVNENTTGAGALRYALQLQFMSPLPKKSSRSFQRSTSDPSSVPAANKMDIVSEQRFYLYSNMRVVFPQRHSDSDEGKVYFVGVYYCPLMRRNLLSVKSMLWSAYCLLSWMTLMLGEHPWPWTCILVS